MAEILFSSKMNINQISTIQRALGMIEGASFFLGDNASSVLGTAVEMIDGVIDKMINEPSAPEPQKGPAPAMEPKLVAAPANQAAAERPTMDTTTTIARNDKPDIKKVYKGFLRIKCEACGKEKAFCSKNFISHHICECGHKTELRDLRYMFVDCKNDHHFKYQTNMTEQQFTVECLECGSPVDLELHDKNNEYVSI